MLVMMLRQHPAFYPGVIGLEWYCLRPARQWSPKRKSRQLRRLLFSDRAFDLFRYGRRIRGIIRLRIHLAKVPKDRFHGWFIFHNEDDLAVQELSFCKRTPGVRGPSTEAAFESEQAGLTLRTEGVLDTSE